MNIPNHDQHTLINQCLLYYTIGQQFIIPSGLRASLYRYNHYNPKYNTSSKQNYAFFISNTAPINISKAADSSKIDLDLFPAGCQIFKIHSMSSFNFGAVAEQLITFILKHYGITVKQIVLDFVKDLNGTEWLLGCKAFKTVKKHATREHSQHDKLRNAFLKSLSRTSTEAKKLLIFQKREQLIEDATTSAFCKLCKINFRRDQLRRLVTDSMILRLISHLRKRGVFTFEFSQLSNNNTQTEATSLVCDLCYMLIVAENDLIRIENAFSKLLSIPQPDELESFPIASNDNNRLKYLSTHQTGTAKDQEIVNYSLNNQNYYEAQIAFNKILHSKIIKIEELPVRPIQWRILLYLKDFLKLDMERLRMISSKDVYV